MKRYLLFFMLAFGAMTPTGLAVDKEIIQLQQSVALLQGLVRDLQRNFDEKMAVMRTLIEQTGGQSGQLSSSLNDLQQTLQTSVANAAQKVDNLNSQIQGVQASIDELRARIDRISQQVAKIEANSQSIQQSSTAGLATDLSGTGPPPAPDVLYNTALRDYTGGNYPLALQEFLEYLRYYANTALASNAQFYIGDIYYQQGQFEKAVQEYDKAIEQYPDGNKTAAAELKKGYSLLNLGLRKQGLDQLEDVVKRFPNTQEAQLAKDRIAQVEAEKPATPPTRRRN